MPGPTMSGTPPAGTRRECTARSRRSWWMPSNAPWPTGWARGRAGTISTPASRRCAMSRRAGTISARPIPRRISSAPSSCPSSSTTSRWSSGQRPDRSRRPSAPAPGRAGSSATIRGAPPRPRHGRSTGRSCRTARAGDPRGGRARSVPLIPGPQAARPEQRRPARRTGRGASGGPGAAPIAAGAAARPRRRDRRRRAWACPPWGSPRGCPRSASAGAGRHRRPSGRASLR